MTVTKQVFGAQSARTAGVLDSQGMLSFLRGDYRTAEASWRQAVAFARPTLRLSRA